MGNLILIYEIFLFPSRIRMSKGGFRFFAAFAVAVLLSGAVQFIAERMHIQRGIVAVAVVLFFYIILAVFLYFAGSYLVRLIYDLNCLFLGNGHIINFLGWI